jgi:hypothetical protein
MTRKLSVFCAFFVRRFMQRHDLNSEPVGGGPEHVHHAIVPRAPDALKPELARPYARSPPLRPGRESYLCIRQRDEVSTCCSTTSLPNWPNAAKRDALLV